jgi:hypothetical protein
VARVTPPAAIVERLAKASNALAAVTGLIEEIANLLRQLVHVAGWLLLLYSTIRLMIHPTLSPGHLVVSGAGALAVLQGLIKSRRPMSGATVELGESAQEIDVEAIPPALTGMTEAAPEIQIDGVGGLSRRIQRPPCSRSL